MKLLLVILLVLLLAASVVIFRLARRIEWARKALAAKKAVKQDRLRQGGLTAELDYIVEQIDRELAGESDVDEPASASRTERLRELKTVLVRNHESEPTAFDAAGATADVVEAWRRQAPDGEIAFSLPSRQATEVAGDPDLFRWSLRELFSNVLAHGGAWSRIAVGLDCADGAAVLSFTDDGEGPDLTTTSRLYGSFTPRIESEGPGLGLFAVRSIVEKMGGSIKASPGDDGGLSHTVRLPLSDAGRAGVRRSEVASLH
jgi:signal transduction histidine kinase